MSDITSPQVPDGNALSPPDLRLRLLGFRRRDVTAWWIHACEQFTQLQATDAAKLTRIHELELELERMRGRVRDWEEREDALNHQLEMARDAFQQIEHDSRARTAEAEQGVEHARHRAEQLIELQASVSDTLSAVVQQVTSTMAQLSRQQPTHRAHAIREAARQVRPMEDTIASPTEDMPDNVRPLRADGTVGASANDSSPADAPLSPITPPTPVMTGYDAAVEREILATGLSRYSQLGGLEGELASVPGIVDLHVESFHEDTANIRVSVSSSMPLAELLNEYLGADYVVESREFPPGAVIHCHVDAASG